MRPSHSKLAAEVYSKVVDGVVKEKRERILIKSQQTYSSLWRGGRKDTLMREYTAVEVEGIARNELQSDLEKLLREGAGNLDHTLAPGV